MKSTFFQLLSCAGEGAHPKTYRIFMEVFSHLTSFFLSRGHPYPYTVILHYVGFGYILVIYLQAAVLYALLLIMPVKPTYLAFPGSNLVY